MNEREGYLTTREPFSDRVMATVAGQPMPSPTRALLVAVRRLSVRDAGSALWVAWHIGTARGWRIGPRVRVRSMALVFSVVALLAVSGSLAAAGASQVIERATTQEPSPVHDGQPGTDEHGPTENIDGQSGSDQGGDKNVDHDNSGTDQQAPTENIDGQSGSDPQGGDKNVDEDQSGTDQPNSGQSGTDQPGGDKPGRSGGASGGQDGGSGTDQPGDGQSGGSGGSDGGQDGGQSGN
jgi:uncharacterized membrane protein YgcG